MLLNKALIELPPQVAGRPPMNPDAIGRIADGAEWRGAAGLAEDIRWYGKWMRDRAWEHIGHLYPKAQTLDGKEATVIAWLWARTVPCPNPACGVAMPLITTFELSKKQGNRHWIRPVVHGSANTISFVAQPDAEGVEYSRTVDGKGAQCIACGATTTLAYVREQSKAGRLGEQMTAIVAEGDRRRLFLSPTEEHVRSAKATKSVWRPQQKMPATTHLVSGRGYGINEWSELFTERQLIALTTFSDLVLEARLAMKQHDMDDEYADIVSTYLALAIGRLANSVSSYARWQNTGDFVAGVFSRQAIAMIWDFGRGQPLLPFVSELDGSD